MEYNANTIQYIFVVFYGVYLRIYVQEYVSFSTQYFKIEKKIVL